MQKSRLRSRLPQRLLSVSGAAFLAASACARAADQPAEAPAATLSAGSNLAPAQAPAAAGTPPDDEAERTESEGHAPSSAELPRGTLVLHVGDSFAGALGVPLGKRLKAAGLRSVLEFQTSSYIPTWASSRDLSHYVTRYSPDLVLITLGANEFELSAPETRAGAVRRLVKQIEGRPCVWISPPRWKQDTGILAVIRENSKPCRYLDSDTIVHDLPRKSDKIHPSDVGREVWADAVLSWLVHERQTGAERPWQFREEE